jgi:hypothetical protein
MKTISLWQPWASLIAMGIKRIETRSWHPKYSGPIAIHASKRRMDEFGAQLLWQHAGFSPGDAILATAKFPYGSVIAVCNLDRSVQTMGGAASDFLYDGDVIKPPEYHFGDYSPGRQAWFLSNVRKLATPIPWCGRQKWFEVPDALIEKAIAT